MAKYLDTSQISSELMQLIKEAKDKIILVTYSLQVNTQIQERLKTKSKLGTVGDISLIYGNTQLKRSELEWMKEVDDLKVWQKKNLHAKCYVNENRAIITSMNLYDYSQTNNVEMGILITKEDDEEAYLKMIEDIDHLRINGDRIREPWLELVPEVQHSKQNHQIESPKTESKTTSGSSLSFRQQAQKQLLTDYRKIKSLELKQKAESILSDQDITDILTAGIITKGRLSSILKSEKKAKQLGSEIMDELDYAQSFHFGRVLDLRYQTDDFSYDQIKLQDLETNETTWYNTKKELPRKGDIVAVQLNKNWFNHYIKLEETSVKSTPTRREVDYKNAVLKTTKDLAALADVSSKIMNECLVDIGVMRKTENDWILTKKGGSMGGQEREGQYGKFIVWPEQILNELKF